MDEMNVEKTEEVVETTQTEEVVATETEAEAAEPVVKERKKHHIFLKLVSLAMLVLVVLGVVLSTYFQITIGKDITDLSSIAFASVNGSIFGGNESLLNYVMASVNSVLDGSVVKYEIRNLVVDNAGVIWMAICAAVFAITSIVTLFAGKSTRALTYVDALLVLFMCGAYVNAGIYENEVVTLDFILIAGVIAALVVLCGTLFILFRSFALAKAPALAIIANLVAVIGTIVLFLEQNQTNIFYGIKYLSDFVSCKVLGYTPISAAPFVLQMTGTVAVLLLALNALMTLSSLRKGKVSGFMTFRMFVSLAALIVLWVVSFTNTGIPALDHRRLLVCIAVMLVAFVFTLIMRHVYKKADKEVAAE